MGYKLSRGGSSLKMGKMTISIDGKAARLAGFKSAEPCGIPEGNPENLFLGTVDGGIRITTNAQFTEDGLCVHQVVNRRYESRRTIPYPLTVRHSGGTLDVWGGKP